MGIGILLLISKTYWNYDLGSELCTSPKIMFLRELPTILLLYTGKSSHASVSQESCVVITITSLTSSFSQITPTSCIIVNY